MTLVYDDEVEKLWVVLLKISRKVVFTIRLIASSLGDSLIDGKKHICVGRRFAVSLSYLYAVYLDALFFYGVELIVRLVYEDISVGEKERSWSSICPVFAPFGFKEPIDDLKGDIGLARTRRKCEQDSIFAARYRLYGFAYRYLLIISRLLGS